jgi:hypothetical protein
MVVAVGTSEDAMTASVAVAVEPLMPPLLEEPLMPPLLEEPLMPPLLEEPLMPPLLEEPLPWEYLEENDLSLLCDMFPEVKRSTLAYLRATSGWPTPPPCLPPQTSSSV